MLTQLSGCSDTVRDRGIQCASSDLTGYFPTHASLRRSRPSSDNPKLKNTWQHAPRPGARGCTSSPSRVREFATARPGRPEGRMLATARAVLNLWGHSTRMPCEHLAPDSIDVSSGYTARCTSSLKSLSYTLCLMSLFGLSVFRQLSG